MRVAWCCTLLALCSALLVQGTPLPAAKADAAQTEAAATQEEGVDGQVSATIQEVEKQQNDESPREKRAGAGGSFLNELNQGPTYSQLLGQSGGGFNKLGILSGLLGSSSGGGAAGGGDAAGGSGSGSGSILSLITPLLGSSSGPNVASLVDLGLLGLNLAGGDGASPLPGNPSPAAGVDEASSPDLEDAGSEDDVIAVTAQNLIEDSSSGGGAGASAGASVSLGGGLDGGLEGGDIGVSAGASIDGDTTGSAGAGSAGAGAGSDSGSILSLVTPLLGSSSQGSGGDGTASGGGNPATAGTFGGGFLGTILSAVFSIKSFIFRKIVQLLTSSSGSPQAG